MGGYNLPPGVSVRDIPGNRPEDELAEMIAEGWRPHCEKCSGFLAIYPEKVESWEETVPCSGIPRELVCHYNDGTHEAILRIIGEEYRDQTYTVYYTDCGEETGEGGHPAHDHITSDGIYEYRTCHRCGHLNKWVEL